MTDIYISLFDEKGGGMGGMRTKLIITFCAIDTFS